MNGIFMSAIQKSSQANTLLSEHIHYSYCVRELDTGCAGVNDGDFTGDYIINTAPWQEFAETFPAEIKRLTETLLYASVDIDYCDEPSDTDAHWTYYADETLPYHRKIHRDNIIAGSKGFWTETNSRRRKTAEPAVRAGNLTTARDFINVRDGVKAMMLLLENGKPGMAANICTGKAHKIGDILNMLIDISGLKVDVIEDKSLLRASDEPLLLGDNKITERGFKPSYTICETLRGVYEDWLNRV
jgi:hypothetical protein